MKRINPGKMSAAELDKLGREAEAVTFENTRPLSAEGRRALNLAARKGGRQRIGQGAQRINVSVERGLLAKVDAFARKIGVTRAALVADGLRKVVKA